MVSPTKSEGLGRFKDFLSPLLSIFAIALSSYSLYTSERTHQDVARADAIKTEYALFDNLAGAQLEHPLMAHLFAVTGKAYDARSEQIAATVSGLDNAAKAKLLLEERAMAHLIFTTYEESYYNWEHAVMVGDKDRATLLREDLDYYEDQLCNRRLLWYWDIENGDKLGLAFSGRVQKFYKDTTIKECEEENDPEGPFNLTADNASKTVSSPAKSQKERKEQP